MAGTVSRSQDPRDDLHFADIGKLSRLLRTRKLSSLELTRHVLERLRAEGPRYNAVAQLTPELAEDQARAADRVLRKGATSHVTGIPYGAKDTLSAAGIPTRWGSRAFKDQIFDYDAAVIQRLRVAGSPLVAKLATVEFGGAGGYRYVGGPPNGAGLNPWNVKHWAGGSSGGSASAVAVGLVPFALGGETRGSIMIPSAFCGVTGFRPSHGVVSNFGGMPLAWSMDKIGPIARSAQDCAFVAAVLIGKDDRDPTSIEMQLRPSRLKGRQLRVGVLPLDFSDVPATATAFDEAIKVFRRLGARIKRLALPDRDYAAIAKTIVAAEAGAAHEQFLASTQIELISDDSQREGLRAFLQQPPLAYVRAAHDRAYAIQEIRRLFTDVDVLVAPTMLTESPRVNADLSTQVHRSPFVSFGSVAGLPGLTVPMGFGTAQLPLGLSIIGDRLHDATVLRVGVLFQSATDWHLRRPDVATAST